MRHERTLRMAVRVSETGVLVVGEDPLCSLEEVAVAHLHVLEPFGGTGSLAVTGLGAEAGGQSVRVGVEALEQTDWSPGEEAEALVCQVEVVEVQQL